MLMIMHNIMNSWLVSNNLKVRSTQNYAHVYYNEMWNHYVLTSLSMNLAEFNKTLFRTVYLTFHKKYISVKTAKQLILKSSEKNIQTLLKYETDTFFGIKTL